MLHSTGAGASSSPVTPRTATHPRTDSGSNTSIQDAYNLAWKLALVVSGRAGDGLLDTYDDERQPVGRQVVDRANQSVGEMLSWLGPMGVLDGRTPEAAVEHLDEIYGPNGEATRTDLLAGLETMNAQFNAHGVEMGQRYSSSAVVDDGMPFPQYTQDPELHYHPTTHPGAALPHAWLGRGTHDISTVDLCAYDRFTLLVGADGADWELAAVKIGDELGVEIRPFAVALGQEHNDVLGTWTRSREVTDRGCVLVRPDHFVAWRSHDRVADPVEALRATMHQVLDLAATDFRSTRPEGALT